MTTPEEPKELDHEAGARFMEKLLAEDPAKAFVATDVATDEQVDAMMDAAGIEVGPPDTTEQMLARVERRRRERQTRAGAEVAPAPPVAATKPTPKKPASRVAWVAGAVVAAAAAAGVVAEVGSRVGPEAIGPEPSSSPTPRELAAGLRREALAACDARDFVACTAKLDDAKRLDPAGESEPRVLAARAAVAASTAAPQVPSGSSEGQKPRLK